MKMRIGSPNLRIRQSFEEKPRAACDGAGNHEDEKIKVGNAACSSDENKRNGREAFGENDPRAVLIKGTHEDIEAMLQMICLDNPVAERL